MQNKISINQPNILIVDDEHPMREMLSELFIENYFNPIATESSANIKAILEQNNIALAVIDLKLGSENGLDIAKVLHKSYNIPIIMMTGIGGDIDKIVGLEAGMDDYIMKPFNPREIIARIKAVLRRSSPDLFKYLEPSTKLEQTLYFGDYTLNLITRTFIDLNKKEIDLTNSEFKVLEFLLQNKNKIVTRKEILDYLGIENIEQYIDRNVDVIVMRLRHKIEELPSKPTFIQTRRHKGYILIT